MSSFGLSYAPSETLGFIPERLARLTAIMARKVEEKKAPGVSMLIARHGRIAHRASVGALRPGGPAMTDDAIFRIYSMTKPIVSVAAMMLVEEGHLLITDPVSKFIPAFENTKVGIVNGDKLDLAPLKRPITVQDLMRHTSGLTYDYTGASPVQKLVAASGVGSQKRTLAEQVEALAALPLMHQPGEVWEYSLSTDVLGRVVEIVEGAKLGEVLSARIFEPLGMDDTAFFIPPSKLPREAKPMSPQVYTSLGLDPNPMTEPPRFESGGGGLLSTIGDYARFAAMLSSGGELDGVRILGPRMIRFMASDHLGSRCRPQPRAACAGPRIRPRLRRAPAIWTRDDARIGRRLFLGRLGGNDIQGFAARLPVRDFHDPGAGQSRAFWLDVWQSAQRGNPLTLRQPKEKAMSSFALPYAPSETLGFIPERLERLTAIMARQVEEKKAPGVSMLIARHGKIAYREMVGALRPGGPAMTDDAIFRIYSMTKPIVSVAAMMLVEEGRLLITDPVSKYIPAFANTKVGVANGDKIDLAPLKRPITVQDLMRHTSGLTYGFTGASPVQKLVKAANVADSNRTSAENVEAMAALPLMHQPGEVWEYSLSTDVLGRIVEIVEGARSARSCMSACLARSRWSTPPSTRPSRKSPGAPIRSRSTS